MRLGMQRCMDERDESPAQLKVVRKDENGGGYMTRKTESEPSEEFPVGALWAQRSTMKDRCSM